MKLLLVLNPGSRSGRGRRRWAFWMAGLRRAGLPFETAETRSLRHAREIARAARAFDAVVAVGGDGTINAVLAGLADARVAGQRMGVLYTGTSPDFCRFHGIPVDPIAALDTLRAGHACKVDVAAIRYHGPDGPADSWFGCSCNIGMGAAVAAAANRWRRRVGDAVGTALAVLRAVTVSKPLDMDVEIDGGSHVLRRTNHLVVLKNPWIASGLRLDVDRKPDDGRLTVMAVTGRSRLGLCALLPAFYSGAAVRAGGVFLREGARVSVRASALCELEFDGDPRGRLPAEVEVKPRWLELISAA